MVVGSLFSSRNNNEGPNRTPNTWSLVSTLSATSGRHSTYIYMNRSTYLRVDTCVTHVCDTQTVVIGGLFFCWWGVWGQKERKTEKRKTAGGERRTANFPPTNVKWGVNQIISMNTPTPTHQPREVNNKNGQEEGVFWNCSKQTRQQKNDRLGSHCRRLPCRHHHCHRHCHRRVQNGISIPCLDEKKNPSSFNGWSNKEMAVLAVTQTADLYH